MRLVISGPYVWTEKSITIQVGHKINLKLWRKIQRPEGWSKRCIFNRHSHGARVMFRALQFDAPHPSAEWYEEIICKLHMIEEKC